MFSNIAKGVDDAAGENGKKSIVIGLILIAIGAVLIFPFTQNLNSLHGLRIPTLFILPIILGIYELIKGVFIVSKPRSDFRKATKEVGKYNVIIGLIILGVIALLAIGITIWNWYKGI